MRFLADMGVSVRVVEWLIEQGHDAAHIRDEQLHRLPNGEIFSKAAPRRRAARKRHPLPAPQRPGAARHLPPRQRPSAAFDAKRSPGTTQPCVAPRWPEALVVPGAVAAASMISHPASVPRALHPFRGTLGVLLLARKRGLLADLEPVLDQIQRAGMHIKSDIVDALRGLA